MKPRQLHLSLSHLLSHLLRLALAFSCLMHLPQGQARAFEPDGAPDMVRALAGQAARAPLLPRSPYDERDWLERFYQPRGYAPVWGAPDSARATAALELLQQAASDGLVPADYKLNYQADADPRQADGGPAFDVALTRSMLRYLAELHVGRIRPSSHASVADARLEHFDPVEQLRAALAEGRLGSIVDAARPALPLYRQTRALLAHYRALAAQEQALPQLPALPGARKLVPGAPYGGAALLRARLILLGDLAPETPAGLPTHYSADLAAAVKRFQGRHGMAVDGIIGKSSMAALKVPLAWRVQQLELTLERLRWLGPIEPGPLIAVNIPTFRLWAYGPGADRPSLDMRVIVGRASVHPTPLFVGQLRRLEFNPYWNVPYSIARDEIIPALERDPAFLKRSNMELVPTGAAGVPLRTLDAAALKALKAGHYRVRQRPGPGNAMGSVKFVMPNPDSIYLHSTGAPRLFKRLRRDLSHGCIRVERPFELAQFVLADHPDWSVARIEQAMAPGASQITTLNAPIPVLLLYATALSDADGKAIFANDIYRRDGALLRALKAQRTAEGVRSDIRTRPHR